MKTRQYEGLLLVGPYGDASNILYLAIDGRFEEPLVDILRYDISNKNVSVRYFITDRQVSLEEAQTEFIEQLIGRAKVNFMSHYSEITGYLWTDEEINIGGHDLVQILKSHVGKYLILIIDIH